MPKLPRWQGEHAFTQGAPRTVRRDRDPQHTTHDGETTGNGMRLMPLLAH